MSRDTRTFFVQPAHLFKEHSVSSRSTSSSNDKAEPPRTVPQLSTPLSSSSVNVPSPEALPRLQPPAPSLSHPSNPSNPLPRGSPALPPPQSLRPPTPPATSSSTTPFSNPLLCSVEHGIPSSNLITVSSLDHDTPPPQSLTLRRSTPDPGPSTRPPTLHTLMPQLGERTNFAGAHDFIINNPQFSDISHTGSGLKELLKNSMPDAFHNSAARYPPPRCHLGTRNNYITEITNWAHGNSDHQEPILWMRGPFGIGKSAVAQSCAEALQSQNKLAAALFFSRSNTDRDDPRRVFTSIAYQIAIICPPFRDIVDARVRNDPALAMKSLFTQFEELLVHPLRQIDVVRNGIDRRVVVIDGLDECRGSSGQCEIIEIIAASARNRTTPFRWFITSRPEDPIIQTMNTNAVSSVSFHLELPVSRDIDHEILVYLTDEFEKIRQRHRLPSSWVAEEALALLVERTAGLWIYASTIIRFVMDENSLGPQDQLRIVLEFAKDISARGGPDNPLAEMDFFYTLIMQRIPLKIRTLVRKILLLSSDFGAGGITTILNLTEEQFRRSCTSIQSVMELRGLSFVSMSLHFYHASFLDFMKDPERSKELCIHGNFLIEYRRECLDWLHHVCSHSTGLSNMTFPLEPVLLEGWDRTLYYSSNLEYFWKLCSVPNHPLDLRTATSLEKLQFRMMLRLMGNQVTAIGSQALRDCRNNLPIELRDRIIRLDKCLTPGCTNIANVWIFGHGENETVAESEPGGHLRLRNNQGRGPDWCPCGYVIEMKRGNRHKKLGLLKRLAARIGI